MDYLKEFNRTMQQMSSRKGYRIPTIFADFCRMAAISLAQPFYKDETLENEYLEVVGRYERETVDQFPKLLAITVNALEQRHRDFLGEVFMSNEMGNEYKGQFFTPYHISKMMAMMVQPQSKDSMCEPCVGAGSMVIAAHEINPNLVYVEATDIDELCFFMAYIQLSLYGIPARVVHGNTLSMEMFRQLYTPGYFLTGRHLVDQFRRLFPTEERAATGTTPSEETIAVTNEPAHASEQLTLWDWA